MRFAPTSFRPLFGRILSVVVAVVCAGGIASFAIAGDVDGLVRYSWPLLLIAVLVFTLYFRPSLDVAEHEVTVRNPFVTVHVPWPAIERVDTKWALTLFTADGKITAWASPAPNRYAAHVTPNVDTRLAARDGGTSVRPGDLPNTSSGAPALVIRSHFEELRETGLLDAGVEPGTLRREVHWGTVATLGALVLLTVLGATL